MDSTYKTLFSFRRMVADLLRMVLGAELLEEADLETLEKLPAEYVSDSGLQRRGDTVWRVRFRGGWLLVLLEFQSTKENDMPLRNWVYSGLLYQDVHRRGGLGEVGDWPPMLCVVVYSGDTPWGETLELRDLFAAPRDDLFVPSQRTQVVDAGQAVVDDLPVGNLMRALVGFEQARSLAGLVHAARDLRRSLRLPDDAQLARVFAEWMREMAVRIAPGHAPPELGKTLEDSMSLLDRIAEWPEQWRQEGVAAGRREGVAAGRREGVAAARREGVARQRALVQRLVEARFGRSAGAEVGTLLAATDDWDRLSDVAELILGASSGEELTARVADVLRRRTDGRPPA